MSLINQKKSLFTKEIVKRWLTINLSAIVVGGSLAPVMSVHAKAEVNNITQMSEVSSELVALTEADKESLYQNVEMALAEVNQVAAQMQESITASIKYYQENDLASVLALPKELNDMYFESHYELISNDTKQAVIDQLSTYEIDANAAKMAFLENGKAMLESDWERMEEKIFDYNIAVAEYNRIDPAVQLKTFDTTNQPFRNFLQKINTAYQWYNGGVDFNGNINKNNDYNNRLDAIIENNAYYINLRWQQVEDGTIGDYEEITTGGWYALNSIYNVTDLDRYWYALYDYRTSLWLPGEFCIVNIVIPTIAGVK